jgi:adenosylhomocysteine nucleosidase
VATEVWPAIPAGWPVSRAERGMIASVALGAPRVVRGGLAGVEQVVAARLQGRAAFGDRRGCGRHGEPYRGGLCRRGGASVRGAARHQRSRQPGAAGAGDGRDQAERRYRSAQGPARRRAVNPTSIARCCAAPLVSLGRGLDFNRALRSLRGCRGFLLGGEPRLVAADL